jgi:hypothetical protein
LLSQKKFFFNYDAFYNIKRRKGIWQRCFKKRSDKGVDLTDMRWSKAGTCFKFSFSPISKKVSFSIFAFDLILIFFPLSLYATVIFLNMASGLEDFYISLQH